MALTDLSPTLQNIIQLEYELQVKVILLFGWWVLSLFYVFYLHKQQEPTKYFIVGTFRAINYSLSYLWMWMFWLLFPVYISPTHGIDELLIFLATVYSILFFVFTTMLIVNAALWIPKFVITKGKIDITNWEDNAFKQYFGNWGYKKPKK